MSEDNKVMYGVDFEMEVLIVLNLFAFNAIIW